MSASIYIKLQLTKKFYSIEISNFLFDAIKEGCNRQIAVTIPCTNEISYDENECILSLSDSFNFELVTPLIGLDCDGEVLEYRSLPLRQRLENLQALLQYIGNKTVVEAIEVFFTHDFDIDVGISQTCCLSYEEFALKAEKIITNDFLRELGIKFKFNL